MVLLLARRGVVGGFALTRVGLEGREALAQLGQLCLEFAEGLLGAGVGGRKTPATVLAIEGGPDPEEGPDGVQGKETDPTGDVQGILLGMIALFGDLIRDVVDGDNPIEDYEGDEKEKAQGKIIKKHEMTPKG